MRVQHVEASRGSPSRPIDWKPDTARPPSPFKPSSTLRLGGVGTTGYISHVASGGNPMAAFPDDPRGQKELRPEFDSPCGSPTHPVVSKADACRPLPPYEPSSTLRLGGMGTNGHILHEASGGNPRVASPDGPCDLLRSRPDRARDACHRGPHVETPSPCLELPCSTSCVLHAASGGSTKCPNSINPGGCMAETENSCSPLSQGAQQHQSQPSSPSSVPASWHHRQVVESQQVVESPQVVDCNNTPLSPPEPFTAAFVPDLGPMAAMPHVSVQGVSSTPIHGCAGGARAPGRALMAAAGGCVA